MNIRSLLLCALALLFLLPACQSTVDDSSGQAVQGWTPRFSVEDDREYAISLIREIESEFGHSCGTRFLSLVMEFSKYGDPGWDLLEAEFEDLEDAKWLRSKYGPEG